MTVGLCSRPSGHLAGKQPLLQMRSLSPRRGESQRERFPCYVVSYDHGGLVLWGDEHFAQHLREKFGWLDRHPKLKMGLDNEAWTSTMVATRSSG